MTLDQQSGLTTQDLALIQQAASRQQEITKLVLFGSRAKGCYRKGSDVDLAVQGSQVDDQSLSLLADQLNEALPLPYFFDVLHYDTLTDPALKAHIDNWPSNI